MPRRKPEIMSPAGYWPQLRAAIEAGADAVYFGLHHFSARAKVGFSLEELPEVMRTLHTRGVRGFVTFNTLVFEHEIEEAARTIAAIARTGADALIVQDYGIVRLARQIAPDLELHASTQMSITNAEGVKLAQSFGIERVNLARELSLDEIRKIIAETGCDLEMFVHGALCVAYSGQCFSSEAWGGRSANRGQCAQACRLPYQMIVDGRIEPLGDARYLLSPGDLFALEQIPEIVEIGVAALKIEGRYKDADYVALTTQAYRKAVDEAWAGRSTSITRAEKLRLEQVYSRGLGPFFLTGTNHQAVVKGRAPRHRGVEMGRVARVHADHVEIEPVEAQEIAPLKPGDGVVFDAADWRSPGEPEEGGRIYQVQPGLDGTLALKFGNGAIQFDRIRAGDIVWRTDDADIAKAARPFLEAASPVAKQPVRVKVKAMEGAKLWSEWSAGGASVVVTSDAALETAQNRGLAEESLRRQLERLGNTPYELRELTLEIQGSPFAPASVLNQMRREAVEKLQAEQARVRPSVVHDVAIPTPVVMREPRPGPCALHLLVRNAEQLDAAIELRPSSITLDYLDLYGLRPSVERVKQSAVAVRVASPRVLKPGESRILNFLLSLDCPILLRPAGMLHALRERAHPPLIGDFSLNAANSITAEAYFVLGLDKLTPTHDLNAAQVADLAKRSGADRIEVVAYQHLPVFHTEHCVFCRFLSTGTTYRDCGRPCEKHRVELRDESGRAHPVLADVGCRNTVFGAEAQEASRHLETWKRAGISHYRLEFVHETPEQVRRVAKAFGAALAGEITAPQLSAELKRTAPEGTTEGSLFIPADYLKLPILQ
ncbi:MAG TPA: U32 family peptidase [Bryobacteraceae bacterium]|nr:U32 family peptidase [Bryobacteraceae bacterium]